MGSPEVARKTSGSSRAIARYLVVDPAFRRSCCADCADKLAVLNLSAAQSRLPAGFVCEMMKIAIRSFSFTERLPMPILENTLKFLFPPPHAEKKGRISSRTEKLLQYPDGRRFLINFHDGDKTEIDGEIVIWRRK